MDKEQAARLGSWLRERRQQLGLSTVQLAKQTGTTDGTITRIEQGAFTAPAPDKLARIAQALRLSLADVYTMAEYAVPDDLPSFQLYLRRKYQDLSAEAIEDINAAFRAIIEKHGYDPDALHPGEDELPEPQPTSAGPA